ncbi:MAG TPA: preprotein translocase subunit YajC [Atribacteraceae bacterium]|nr:preprotein translocase subunit YajC [Atribacteraceae bacterium]
MSFFLSIAHAATEAPAVTTPQQPGAPGAFTQLLPLIFIVVIFYFLLIRPQQQRQKAQRELWKGITKGDKVVTAGGMHGMVVQVGEETIVIEVAKDVKVEFSKSAVSAKK